ncbi:ATP-binding cassette transporter abc4 [Psilocybe cubensis]|uniref:ATP-binding cassette transporter abc4 n=1 Tax=Psilocybe cubensis TaxID=181762 RepID=A0ACB8GYB6_PSICU|nr:ATP-binding cassette transporter abc4 [Psilocybe cubensis]KAH9480738.1 ATP-binding cassette transporter abc4 [Psilocybe cubensis]
MLLSTSEWQIPIVDMGGLPAMKVQGVIEDIILNKSLVIPFYCAGFFATIQILHALISTFRRNAATSPASAPDESHVDSGSGFLQSRIHELGGRRMFAFYLARLTGCIALSILSAISLQTCQNDPINLDSTDWLGCPETYVFMTFLYSTLLALTSILIDKWSILATRYNIVLLLVTLAVYAARDVWPLATVEEIPMDTAYGNLLWVRIAILAVTALIVPLFIPRRYIPIDPKDPMPVTNDEQTCSIFALFVYTYLDPVILLGYRVPHLRFDQLPPLSDSDYAKHLTNFAFPHLDVFKGAKRRHLFFGLMRVFRKEYTIVGFTIIMQGLFQFLSPIGVNRILIYLETNGENATVRPWFWILCLFCGPFFRAIAFQWYIFIATRTLVRTEAILTQLVFEHSLRIRIKAETADTHDGPGVTDSDVDMTVGTPDTSSIAESASPESENDAASVSTEGISRTASEATVTGSSIKKGKTKSGSTGSPPPSKEERGKPDDANLIGKINNLVTSDLNNIVEARDFIHLFVSVPLQVTLCVVFLYQLLGWSAFVGLFTIVALFPVPGYIAKLIQGAQRVRMKKTDARIQDITEAVNVMRMVKLFGWEQRMSKRIEEKREDELQSIWRLKVLSALNGIVNYLIPTITMIATYTAYTMIMKGELTPSKIFSSITVFNILRLQLNRISYQVTALIQGKVSLDRMDEFLKKTELLDAFSENQPSIPDTHDKSVIGFKNATFSWSFEPKDGSLTPRSRSFRLRINEELAFKPDCINLIIGPTGSGKTSMLMALLGEMHFIPSNPDSWFNLPRADGVAFAAQESWVQNETIRENILFGSPYNETRYKKVIRQCALERDLELFEAGDATEVGEKGLTLSGGQKARITLARAVYSPAKILLLDDVLAALDVHTSTWIVNQCFRGDLIKGRTVLLVTHNVALATPIAEYIVSLAQDGSVKARDNDIAMAIAHDPDLAKEMELDGQRLDVANQEVTSLAKKDTPSNGKLIMKEEIAEGHVTWKSIKLFLSGLGGNYPFVFFSLWLSGNILTDWITTLQTWFLGYWGSQYENHAPSEVHAFYYLATYSSLLLGAAIMYTSAYMYFIYGSMRAARVINASLVGSVLSSTLRWLDETPTGRIIARCTQDIRAVDGVVPQSFADLTELAISMVTKIGVIVIFTPLFLAPGLGVAALGLYLGNMYLKAQLSVKREMSNARSPLLAHFSAAIQGIVSIRAYNAQQPFKAESLKRIDHYVRIARMSYNLNRWIGIRIDLLGDIFTASLASYLVYGHALGAANTGFSLNLAVDFCSMILWWVRFFNEFEVQANSLERIQGFIDIEHEPKPTEDGKPPAAWPTSGDLRVENLSARYSQTGPKVLHDLSFHIKSGERIGIVGRTGSGKSSLTLSLLRCIITEGTVYYDGLATDKINLDALRSNITIIPQTPELLSGTLRRNLDPFEQHGDAVLNDALRAAGLFSLQEELGEARLTLDSNIASAGSNLSVGQKQILALARAMVRGSKLLILDEATSAIDYTTDSVIQTTLRHHLPPDVTVITVAHRLQTIMDADKIVEFDKPLSLLKKEGSVLKALVDESGDKDTLYAMAESAVTFSK